MPKIEAETATLKACSMKQLIDAICASDIEKVKKLNYTRDMLNGLYKGKTPLFYAMNLEGETAMFNFLIHENAYIFQRDEKNETPLHYAACYENPIYVAFLLEYGAHDDVRNKDGLTAAQLAKKMQHIKTAKLILNYDDEIKKAPRKIIELENKYEQCLQKLQLTQQEQSEQIKLLQMQSKAEADVNESGKKRTRLGLYR